MAATNSPRQFVYAGKRMWGDGFRQLATMAIVAVTFTLPARAQESRGVLDQCSAHSESAQRQRKAGTLLSARDGFRACARAECPSMISTFCSSRLTEVEAALPTLVVRARDANGTDLSDLDVWIDQALAGKTDGRAITVDPGPHAIRLRRGGVDVATAPSQVMLEGEKLRAVTVSLAAAPTRSPSLTPEEPRDSPNVAPWVLAGLGVVAIGAGAFFWSSGLSDRSKELEAGGCAPNCSDDVKSSIRNRILVGDGFAVAGVVSIGVAAYLWLKPKAAPIHLHGRNLTIPSGSTN